MRLGLPLAGTILLTLIVADALLPKLAGQGDAARYGRASKQAHELRENVYLMQMTLGE